jgi:hypothetical protein
MTCNSLKALSNSRRNSVNQTGWSSRSFSCWERFVVIARQCQDTRSVIDLIYTKFCISSEGAVTFVCVTPLSPVASSGRPIMLLVADDHRIVRKMVPFTRVGFGCILRGRVRGEPVRAQLLSHVRLVMWSRLTAVASGLPCRTMEHWLIGY